MGAVKSRLLVGGVATAGGGAVVYALATVFLAGATEHCSNPQPRCAVQTNEAIARYTATSTVMGDPVACANWVPPWLQSDPSGGGRTTCGGAPGAGWGICQSAAVGGTVGETLGLQTYQPNPNDSNQNEEPGSFAIKSEWVGTLIQAYQQQYSIAGDGGTQPADFNDKYPYAPSGGGPAGTTYTQTPTGQPPQVTGTNYPYAWGAFDTVYPTNGVCTVSKMYGSKMIYPGPFTVASGSYGGTTLDYEWSNVKVVVDTTIGAIGDQIFADLTITQDGCTQSYTVSILAPKVSCNGTDSNGNTVADNSQCSGGTSDPSQIGMNTPDATMASQIYGSGILPGVPVNCENTFTGLIADAGPEATAPLDYACMPTKNGP
jgi:hypothetical protein